MGLTLIRHPRVLGAGLCYGRTNVPLHPDHTEDLDRALRETPAPAAILTSPATRCRILADALAGAHGLVPEVDDRLAELDFGAWEGRPWAAIPRSESDPWAEDPVNRAPPGGETFEALLSRVRDALAGRRDTIAVTHAGPIRAVMILSGRADFGAAFAATVPHAMPLSFPPLPR